MVGLVARATGEVAVGVAETLEAVLDANVVVLLGLQEIRKAGVDQLWHRRPWFGHCQSGAVDSPTLLPCLDVGVLCAEARPKAAIPLGRHVTACTLVVVRLVRIEEHRVPCAVAEHLHGIVVLWANHKREILRIRLIGALVRHEADAVRRRCPALKSNKNIGPHTICHILL